MILSGIVATGLGHSSQIPDDLKALYDSAAGMALVPGTLNVRLEDPVQLESSAKRLTWRDQVILMAPCEVYDRKAVIIRTLRNEVTQHRVPNNVLEIASDVHLRDHFALEDGMTVTVRLDG